MPSHSVSLYREVDVLIVGSSSAAVAAAVEIRRAGLSALVVSDLPYLGSDLAGTFRLWPGPWTENDVLLRTAFAESGELPARPGLIKRVMEEALLEARAGFLFHSRPAALLRDEAGRLGGVVLATRTALLGVRCRSIIDASEHGIVARLAGATIHERTGVADVTEWTILGKGAPTSWPGAMTEITPSFVQKQEKGPASYRAFRLAIKNHLLGADPRNAEHLMRSQLVDENVLITADLLVRPAGARLANRQPEPGLWMLNSLLPFTAAELEELGRPDRWIALGRETGREAAAEAAGRRIGTDLQVGHHGGRSGDFRFAPAFLRSALGEITVPEWVFPEIGDFDVVISGGGTGGAPAGIAAARAGARTLVLEVQHGLGGVGTIGLISAYWFGNRTGFTAELDREVSRWDSWSRSREGSGWSPEVKSRVYQRMLRDAGGQAWMGSFAFGVRMEGSAVRGLLVSTPFGCGLVDVRAVVDATGDSDVAAAAGAPCRQVGAEHVAVQGSGLSPRFDPTAQYMNSDHTFIDDTDPVGVTGAFVQARAKYPEAFDTVSIVNSRERRQIIGEAEISPLDILAGRTHPDTVYIAESNFDTHGFTVHPVFMMTTPGNEPIRAHVPYRCLLPRKIDGVLVTGLGMSAHRDALPLLRMQADVQNQGYAAGLAAAESARTGIAPRDLDLRALQQKLAAIGIIERENLLQGDSFPMPQTALQKALEGNWEDLANAAILLAHPGQTRESLLQILQSDPHPQRRRDAARFLGMAGDAAAGPALAAIVRDTPWDEGWNYRGMGQFGASLSWLDAAIIALGRTGDEVAVDALEEKILALDEHAAFSHCRAVALAAAMIAHPRLADALDRLLALPGLRGHALTEIETLQARATGDLTETDPRNLSLRELYLAMGLYLSGDPHDTGREILAAYTHDLRGHFARYAQSLLAQTDDQHLLRHRLA